METQLESPVPLQQPANPAEGKLAEVQLKKVDYSVTVRIFVTFILENVL